MPRYSVDVEMTKTVQIKVWARDEDAACEKAQEIVEGWDGVNSAEAVDAEEGGVGGGGEQRGLLGVGGDAPDAVGVVGDVEVVPGRIQGDALQAQEFVALQPGLEGGASG